MTFYSSAEWNLKINFVGHMLANPFTRKLVIFLTCGIAHKISSYSADESTVSRDSPFEAPRRVPLYVSLPLNVSSAPNAATAAVPFPRALARIHWARPAKSY